MYKEGLDEYVTLLANSFRGESPGSGFHRCRWLAWHVQGP
jgi:hypothetical protein